MPPLAAPPELSHYLGPGEARRAIRNDVFVSLAPGRSVQMDWLYPEGFRVRTSASSAGGTGPAAAAGAAATRPRRPSRASRRRGLPHRVSAVDESGGSWLRAPKRLVRPARCPRVVNYIHPTTTPTPFLRKSAPLRSLAASQGFCSVHECSGGTRAEPDQIFPTRHGNVVVFGRPLPHVWGSLRATAARSNYSERHRTGILLAPPGRQGHVERALAPARRGHRTVGGPHKAMPVVLTPGRLWSAIDHGSWNIGGPPARRDFPRRKSGLLDPESWTVHSLSPVRPYLAGASQAREAQLLEGSVVTLPAGSGNFSVTTPAMDGLLRRAIISP